MSLHRAVKWFVAVTLIVGVTASLGAIAQARTTIEPSAVIFVGPHPDDEFQYWSLFENRADVYSVVVLLTRGEQTGFCAPEGFEAGWQPDLEPAPEPIPEAKYSEACAEARVNSFVQYFSDMVQEDETIPGRFADPVTSAPLPDPNGVVCRIDETDECTVSTTVDVYRDLDDRGALLVFDLGDGDLSDAEVEWALRATLDTFVPELVGDDATIAGIVGSYSTPEGGYAGCFAYPHPDHIAIDTVLWATDFGAGFQAAATCATDPRRQLFDRVSDAATAAAFATEPVENSDDVYRTGAHTANYGWLHATYYPVASHGESELFRQDQTFWVRYW
ncbi:hypothetical protein [Salinibacterium sp. SWN248]|uniref:hypothetical protein n=1 Tax=Salinibacterium sp. SWN248 TaxID=2792056 RepID=UPI0018CD68B4|nr:hypothetical protein [Salinibacterium sp. SWN248]MBH0022664.1 hypothetical protein [Salinibacterium sp. SWN248]